MLDSAGPNPPGNACVNKPFDSICSNLFDELSFMVDEEMALLSFAWVTVTKSQKM
jgi:hypothetical protein